MINTEHALLITKLRCYSLFKAATIKHNLTILQIITIFFKFNIFSLFYFKQLSKLESIHNKSYNLIQFKVLYQ